MRNLFLKHKQYQDICWHVKAIYGGTEHTKYKVECWNMGFNNSWGMGIKDYLDIKDTEKDQWLFTTDNISCLRNAKWENLS